MHSLTNAGYGVGSGFDTVKELCPGSDVLEGFEMKGGVERDGILFVMEGEKAAGWCNISFSPVSFITTEPAKL